MRRAPMFVAAGFLLACEPAPTAVDREAVPDILMKADGTSKGAWVMHGGECAVIDGTGAFFLVPCTNEVATYSPNGNATAVTHAEGVPNPTGEVVTWGPDNPGWELAATWELYFDITSPPYPCYVLGPEGEALFTVKWTARVSPSGEAQMICHYSKKWEYQWQ